VVSCLNVIVQRLDPEQGLDAGQQLFPVKGFGQKIIGACFDAADPMGNIVQGRQHHHRQEASRGVRANLLADLIP
jgi:hypothetical protein